MQGKIRMKSAKSRKNSFINTIGKGNKKRLARYCDDTEQAQSVCETFKQA